MKKYISLLLLSLSLPLFGDIFNINYSCFPDLDKVENQIQFVFDNEYCMNEWFENWPFDTEKEKLIEEMTGLYSLFSLMSEEHPENIELSLFAGDLAHYLYNLEETDFYDKANLCYNRARQIDPLDFRPDWLQGVHMCQSALPVKGMELLLNVAGDVPPMEMPAGFWLDYMGGAYFSRMFWHCLMGADYFHQISGEDAGSYVNYSSSLSFKKTSFSYEGKKDWDDLWDSFENKTGECYYRSYPLGIIIRDRENRAIQFGQYQNGGAALFINPPRYEGYGNSQVGVSYVVMSLLNNDEKDLATVMNGLLKDNDSITKQSPPPFLPGALVYEITDPSLYPEQGGGHMYMIGLSRKPPAYPGTALEEPLDYAVQADGETHYYSLERLLSRWKGEIHYVLMLDACEGIWEEASRDFLDFLEQDLILE